MVAVVQRGFCWHVSATQCPRMSLLGTRLNRLGRGEDGELDPLLALALRRLVRKDDNVRTERLRIDEAKRPLLARVFEEALATTQHNWKTISRNSSTRPCRTSAFTSSVLPKTRMSLPGCCLSLDTSSATFPVITVELFHSASRRVV